MPRSHSTYPTQSQAALSEPEIRMILRAADELISVGGRNLLAKLLKGSKDKKVLEHKLDQCPAYGFYQKITIQEIISRIDWMIREDYLRIEYNWKLPVLVFSERGWSIEAETYAEELYEKCCEDMEKGQYEVLPSLRNANRQVAFEVLEKIRSSRDVRLIPLLENWKMGEVQKVQARISAVITSLKVPGDESILKLSRAKRENWREIMNLIHSAAQNVYGKYYSGDVVRFMDMYYSRQRIQGLIDNESVWIVKRCDKIIGTAQTEQNRIVELYEMPDELETYGVRTLQALEAMLKKDYDTIELEVSLPMHQPYEDMGYHIIRKYQMGIGKNCAMKYTVFQKV